MGLDKAYLVVTVIQCLYTGMFLISKAAFDRGMNSFVFVFYRQAAASVLLVPLSILLEWKTAPPISFGIFCKMFLLSLFGITLSLNIYGFALIYTSASLAAATTNCLPVITFFLAIIFGMEVVKLRTRAGITKIAGIVICISGVLVIALYQGPTLKLLLHHHLIGNYHHHAQDKPAAASSKGTTWIKGCFLMIASNTFWGLWIVLQTKVIMSYPSKLLFTTIQCFMSTVQSFVLAIALERDFNQWKLQFDIKLLAVLYCGIVVTGMTFYLQTWVIAKKGPVFLAMFTPMALVLTICSSAFLLGEIISLGSILGGILLVGGLYCVLWGKARDRKVAVANCTTGEAENERPESNEATEEPKHFPEIV